MKLVTASQMRELEQRADASGNSYAQMMEHAGTLCAQAILQRWNVQAKHALVLVGPGNNGGDGLVCARVLHDAGAHVSLYVWRRVPTQSDVNWDLCLQRNIPFTRAEDDGDFSKLESELAHCAFLIDAFLGTGVARPIEGTLKELLETIRASLKMGEHRHRGAYPALPLQQPDRPTIQPSDQRTVVAVDLPTGLNPDTGALDPAALPADLTITFAFPKVGQYQFPGADAVGELVIADIGIPHEWASDIPLDVATGQEICALLPRRPRNSNKGTFGKAMLACGSLQFTGAPVLAARAAGRVGAGLVTLAVPETIHPIVAAKIDEATFLPLPDRLGDWRPRAANELLAYLWDTPYDALLVGCGFGRAESTREFLLRLFENLPALEQPPALVVDADALNLLAEIPEWWNQFAFPTPPILTPHPGEMARLLGSTIAAVQQDRIGVARAVARQWNAIVVLKGAYTIVAAPDERATLIPFANPALATAGTGDVLAGTIAGLLAQLRAATARGGDSNTRRDSYDAAIAGAYVHALTGELAAQAVGDAGTVASDLVPRVPEALRGIKGSRE